MVCGGLFALTCRRQFGCRVFNFWHFSSRAGLRCEGAPGGVRARCGRCADNGPYGDIFERWVRHSLQIPFILLSFKDEGVRKNEDARVIAHDRPIKYILIEYFGLCAVFAELSASLFQLHTLPSASSYVQDDPITDLYSFDRLHVSSRFVCFRGQQRGQQNIFHAAGRLQRLPEADVLQPEVDIRSE